MQVFGSKMALFCAFCFAHLASALRTNRREHEGNAEGGLFKVNESQSEGEENKLCCCKSSKVRSDLSYTSDGATLVGYTPWFYSSNRGGRGGSYMTQFTVLLKGQKYSEGLFRRDMPQGECKGEEPQGGRVHLRLGSSDAYTQLYADNCKWKVGSCGSWTSRSQSASRHCEASEPNLEVSCS